jgi:hypothetical protein
VTGEETDEPGADRYSARVWMLEKTPACTGRLHTDRGQRRRVSRRYAAWLVVAIALTAGCGATAQLTDEPTRNATLSLPAYEQTDGVSSTETRVFWDRSKTWENPGNRSVRVTSQTYTYRNSSGTDTVVVYTTPRKRYVGSDQLRSLPAPDLADLVTRSADVRPPGNDSGPSYRSSLLDEGVTVQTITHDPNDTTGHVAHATRDDAIVVVVVVGEADRSTVERVLGGVTLYGSPGRDERIPRGENRLPSG